MEPVNGTEVKIVTRDGKFGLQLHRHGNSAWHPVNEKHTIFVGRSDRDNDEGSHALWNAEAPINFNELTAAQKRTYLEVLRTNVPQAFWHEAWVAKLARRKAARSAAADKAVEEAEEIVAEAQMEALLGA